MEEAADRLRSIAKVSREIAGIVGAIIAIIASGVCGAGAATGLEIMNTTTDLGIAAVNGTWIAIIAN